jgi:hypothetical protein
MAIDRFHAGGGHDRVRHHWSIGGNRYPKLRYCPEQDPTKGLYQ